MKLINKHAQSARPHRHEFAGFCGGIFGKGKVKASGVLASSRHSCAGGNDAAGWTRDCGSSPSVEILWGASHVMCDEKALPCGNACGVLQARGSKLIDMQSVCAKNRDTRRIMAADKRRNGAEKNLRRGCGIRRLSL
jgi:hypothetical protein